MTMKTRKKTYTNWTPRKMELFECKAGGADPGKLHTYPLAPGESVELSVRDGVRVRWRKYRPEGVE